MPKTKLLKIVNDYHRKTGQKQIEGGAVDKSTLIASAVAILATTVFAGLIYYHNKTEQQTILADLPTPTLETPRTSLISSSSSSSSSMIIAQTKDPSLLLPENYGFTAESKLTYVRKLHDEAEACRANGTKPQMMTWGDWYDTNSQAPLPARCEDEAVSAFERVYHNRNATNNMAHTIRQISDRKEQYFVAPLLATPCGPGGNQQDEKKLASPAIIEIMTTQYVGLFDREKILKSITELTALNCDDIPADTNVMLTLLFVQSIDSSGNHELIGQNNIPLFSVVSGFAKLVILDPKGDFVMVRGKFPSLEIYGAKGTDVTSTSFTMISDVRNVKYNKILVSDKHNDDSVGYTYEIKDDFSIDKQTGLRVDTAKAFINVGYVEISPFRKSADRKYKSVMSTDAATLVINGDKLSNVLAPKYRKIIEMHDGKKPTQPSIYLNVDDGTNPVGIALVHAFHNTIHVTVMMSHAKIYDKFFGYNYKGNENQTLSQMYAGTRGRMPELFHGPVEQDYVNNTVREFMGLLNDYKEPYQYWHGQLVHGGGDDSANSFTNLYILVSLLIVILVMVLIFTIFFTHQSPMCSRDTSEMLRID